MENDENNVRMTLLAESFPSMRNAPGIDPFNPDKLDRWASVGGASHGEKLTARFLLAVWNPGHEWAAGPFDLMEALRAWDSNHHRAFLDWAARPWWP